MGGGDLNQKKSWHPHTMKNQERVWKAEQADAVEKRRMVELQKEIQEERGREDLTKFGQETGVLSSGDGQGGRKLDWMYNKPGNSVNREEYLLGRSVDRAFEQMTTEEQQAVAGSTSNVPKNHVEHECIPTSIRSYMDAPSEQVDMQRKLHEDPLVAIRKREMESRQQLLQNPVKLKELHRILKEEENQRNVSKKLKKHKKKTKKHKNKKHDEKDLDKMLADKYNQLKTTLDNGEEMDIKSLITLKYSRLTEQLGKDKKNKTKRESDSDDKPSKRRKSVKKSKRESDSDDIPSKKRKSVKKSKERYRGLSPQNNKIKSKERHFKSSERTNKHQKESSYDGKQTQITKKRKQYDDDDSDSSSEHKRFKKGTEKSVVTKERPLNMKSTDQRNDSDSEDETSKRSKYSSSLKEIDNNEFDIKSRREMSEERKIQKKSKKRSTSSENNGNEYSRSSRSPNHKRSSRDGRSRTTDIRKKSRSPKRNLQNKKHELEESHKKVSDIAHKKSSYYTNSKKSSKQRSTSSSDSTSSDDNDDRKNYGLVSADGKKLKTNSNLKIEFKTNRKAVKKTWVKTERKRLTAAEIEEKRKEMLENASWREKERDRNIKIYQEEDRKLNEKESGNFDPDFLKKQLSKAANIGTVEGRIKANINNIQRSGRAMDYNFAKRS